MIHRQRTRRCLFVLDTNVLIHDSTALVRFQEHDISLPHGNSTHALSFGNNDRHITLLRGERSRLAEFASETL